MEKLEEQSFEAGRLIFLEGDKDNHFYMIRSGEVEIFTQTKDGSHHLRIAVIGPGESFGEFAMLDSAPRSASARALTDVGLVKISADGFKELLSTLPDWANAMLSAFAHRLKLMNNKLKDVPQFLPKPSAEESAASQPGARGT